MRVALLFTIVLLVTKAAMKCVFQFPRTFQTSDDIISSWKSATPHIRFPRRQFRWRKAARRAVRIARRRKRRFSKIPPTNRNSRGVSLFTALAKPQGFSAAKPMPIIEPLFDRNAHLSQGDILKGVSLFLTTKTWDEGGGGKKTDHSLCLVVSRPCVAAHKEKIIVAAIERYKNKRPDQFESRVEARYYYEDIRDGFSAPDQFYLGQIPGYDGSFCARLDSLHTIQIPVDSQAKAEFASRFRIAVLSADFCRDLHLRVFRAIASLGFDDHRWFATDELRRCFGGGPRRQSPGR